MTTTTHIEIPREPLATFCQRHHIRKLSLFGSVLRSDFSEHSDVDVLVEFEPGQEPGLIGLAGMELELSQLLGGRKVDINTPSFLSPYFRNNVLSAAQTVYART